MEVQYSLETRLFVSERMPGQVPMYNSDPKNTKFPPYHTKITGYTVFITIIIRIANSSAQKAKISRYLEASP